MRRPSQRGLGLRRPHPHRLGQVQLGPRPEPRVLPVGRHRPRLRLHDDVRRTQPVLELEAVAGRPDHRRRQVGPVAQRRAGVDPAHDGLDLLVAQRPVVDEVLDAHGLVEMPRRHLPRLDPRLDRARPGPRLLVGDQRHRGHAAHPVAGLALLLQDGRDVPGESHVGRGRLRRRSRRGQHDESAEQHSKADPPPPGCQLAVFHDALPANVALALTASRSPSHPPGRPAGPGLRIRHSAAATRTRT